MKKTAIVFRFLIIIPLVISTSFLLKRNGNSDCKSEKIFEITAGNSVMKISANGARIVSFKLGKNEMITQIKEHEIFGSTFWPAPQSDWGWPPYNTLDNQEYEVEKNGDTLKFTSKPDSISGLQFQKTFSAKNNKYINIKYLIRNISAKTKKVGPWEVTRVPCGGLAFFPKGEKVKVPKSSLTHNLPKYGINWVPLQNKPTIENQKSFSSAHEGWLAYSLKNTLFIKQFLDTKPDEYSPNQGEVEIYANKERSYAELENHGKYTILQPGESFSYVVVWSLAHTPKSIITLEANEKLLAFARKQLNKSFYDRK